mmetsp:Transcript_68379/g.147540  ORF Transcript_68379/g.147540 Transcript_68379/m.147540 type:complete len:349 (-) Transcript_68379:155-1201(-)
MFSDSGSKEGQESISGEQSPRKRQRVDEPWKREMKVGMLDPTDIDPLRVSLWTDRAKCLIMKARGFNFINAQTAPYLVAQLAKIADKMFVYGGFGKTGDGVALLKHISVGHSIVDQILRVEDYSDLYSNCSEQNAKENKETMWLFYSAFLICFFEVKAKKQFTIQYYHPKELVEQFLAMHPNFSVFNGLVISRLLTFHLCMQIAVSAFELSVKVETPRKNAGDAGSEAATDDNLKEDSNVQRIIELVVRMTEGPELAHAAYRKDDSSQEALMFGAASSSDLRKCRREIFYKILEIKRASRAKKESASVLAAAGQPQSEMSNDISCVAKSSSGEGSGAALIKMDKTVKA